MPVNRGIVMRRYVLQLHTERVYCTHGRNAEVLGLRCLRVRLVGDGRSSEPLRVKQMQVKEVEQRRSECK